MFHIKAPVLLITTAEPKDIKLFFFTSVIVFVWAHRFSICCYLVLYRALHQLPVFFLISFYSILFSVQLCRKVVISSLSTYIHTQERYDSTWNILCVLFLLVQVCLHVCGYQGGGCKAQMLTLSSAWIGRWQMALRGACDTGVSEQAGEHMKGGLCRHVASGCQQGCDEVRPVA